MLISLHHCFENYASLEIFDLKDKDRARKVYSFDRVLGGKLKLILN